MCFSLVLSCVGHSFVLFCLLLVFLFVNVADSGFEDAYTAAASGEYRSFFDHGLSSPEHITEVDGL